MTPIHVILQLPLPFTVGAFVLALAAPGLAQDTGIPGTAGTRVSGSAQVPPITGTGAKPAVPGGTVILFPGGVRQLPVPGGTAPQPPAAPTAPTPAPLPPPSLPGGTVIKRLDVPPLIGGSAAKTDVMISTTPGQIRIGPNPNGRLIDPALLRQSGMASSTISGQPATMSSTTPTPLVTSPAANATVVVNEQTVREPLSEPVQPGTERIPAGDASSGTAFVTAEDAIVNTPPPAPPESAAPLISNSSLRNSGETPPRLSDRLTFTNKDAMHIFYVTPGDAKVAEQSRVLENVGSLSAFINHRNARMAQQQAAVQDCPAAGPPIAGNPPAQARLSLDEWIAGQVIDPHRYCTNSGPFLEPDPIQPTQRGGDGPRLTEPERQPEPEVVQQEARLRNVAYWTDKVTSATNAKTALDKQLTGAKTRADEARKEFERILALLVKWDPKKADWLIEGESNYIERLDGPNGTKQKPSGPPKKVKMASRRKTRVETERDLSHAIESVRGHESVERVVRAQFNDASRALTWAEEKLGKASTGDPGGDIPFPTGPMMAADPAKQ